MNFFLYLSTLACIYLLLSQSMNIYLGFTGILALSHIAFYGIGAYTSAILTLQGLPFPLAFLAAGLIPAGFGCLLGLTSMRLRLDYLGIVTLAFSQIVVSLFQNWESLTRGPYGISAIPKPVIAGLSFDSRLSFFYLTVAITFVLILFMARLVKSPFGKVLETIRDDEIAAMSLGKNTNLYKLTAFAVGAGIAGFAGSLLAHFITYVSPQSFIIDELSFILMVTVVGGLGTFRGPFLGVFLSLVVFEPLRFLPIPAELLGPLRLWIFSVIFVLTLIFVPRGLGGLWKHRSRRGLNFTRY